MTSFLAPKSPSVFPLPTSHEAVVAIASMSRGSSLAPRVELSRPPQAVPPTASSQARAMYVHQKYVNKSNGSTTELNAPTMDHFRDELATALSLAWN